MNALQETMAKNMRQDPYIQTIIASPPSLLRSALHPFSQCGRLEPLLTLLPSSVVFMTPDGTNLFWYEEEHRLYPLYYFSVPFLDIIIPLSSLKWMGSSFWFKCTWTHSGFLFHWTSFFSPMETSPWSFPSYSKPICVSTLCNLFIRR